MSRFSMAAPQPSPADHVFPARAGVPYDEIAEVAWLEAQVASAQITDALAEWRALGQQITRGEAWLDEHDEDDALYRKAQRRVWRRYDQVGAVEIVLWSNRRRCWTACCTLYAAAQHVNGPIVGTDATMDANMRSAGPCAAWRALRGEEPAPGSWPPANDEWTVDLAKPAYAAWMKADLQHELGKLRKALAA